VTSVTVMNANDCRKKAKEFLRAADFIADDFDARLGWLLLCNVWFALAEQIDQQTEKQSAGAPRQPIEPSAMAAVQLGDLLRQRLAL
jgi:hypothetical protein